APSPSPMPIKKLSPAQLKERREKGRCFNCNEKFGPGHRSKKLFLIEGCWCDGGDNDVNMEVEDMAVLQEAETPEISIHAIPGLRTPQTMKVQACIAQRGITILVD
ncbi:hypothetical protein CFOL_v3_12637, partial [Cephalotus follicularis]